MISASGFLDRAAGRGFDLYTGVPCSFIQGFINRVIGSDSLRYVGATNEGDAVAIAAGSSLGGRRAVCMFQNSGLGNAVSPLSSLTSTFRIPILLIVTHRGEPGGKADEPQHELMGRITTDLLDLLGIAWSPFPTDESEIDAVFDTVDRVMNETSLPYALVMSHGSVEPWPAPNGPTITDRTVEVPAAVEPVSRRRDMLAAIQSAAAPDDIIVATTGYTGRELYQLDDRSNQFYMVGSMGCASSFGLGLAIAQPERRVIVADGDGAALMRLGAFSTVGAERPPNLVHVVLDNGRHESTGGQSTSSSSTDLAAVAAATGYPVVERVAETASLRRLLEREQSATVFVHAPIRSGTPDQLSRPAVTPPEVAARLRHLLGLAPFATGPFTEATDQLAASGTAEAAAPAGAPSGKARRLRILVATAVDPEALEIMRARHDVIQAVDADDADLRRLITDRHVVIFRSGIQMSADVMKAAPDLELLIRAGSGTDNIDLDHVAGSDIVLHRIPGPGARSVAELALAHMLTVARRIPLGDRLLRQGVWAKHRIRGDLLRGKTLGVYGTGNIGGAVAEIGVAVGMEVLGVVEHPTPQRRQELAEAGVELVEPADLLRRSDFVVLTTPLTPETYHLVGADEIVMMKPGSYLVNVARGGVLDEQAAVDALESGHLAGVALDVHEKEGDGMTSPLAEHPNVVLTPHIGAGTVDAQLLIGQRILELLDEHSAP